MANGTTGMSAGAGGASATDINSTLKNIVSNIGQEAKAVGALGTASASTLLTLGSIGTTIASLLLAVQSIGSTLATVSHLFGGSVTLTGGTTITTVVDAHALSNSSVTVTAGNNAASALASADGLFVTPGSGQFLITTPGGNAGGTEIFKYVGFNP